METTLDQLNMNFDSLFESQFQDAYSPTLIKKEIDLVTKLQDTRNALQESISECDQLKALITLLYKESRVENQSITELMSQIKEPLFRNFPLPRNADNLPFNEQAGYAVYYMKFLGYATRKVTEEFHQTKEHMVSLGKSVETNSYGEKVDRTGQLRVPELDGEKETKRVGKAAPPPTPPVTPPKQTQSVQDGSRLSPVASAKESVKGRSR
jgi:hypothetical protein